MNCENCNNEHNGSYGSGRFCSIKCSKSFSTKNKRKEINLKVSSKLNGTKKDIEEKKQISKSLINYWKGKERKHSEETKEKLRQSAKNRIKGEIVFKICKVCGNTEEILKYGTICNNCKGDFRLYKEQCYFKFNVFDFEDKFDLSLIEKHGWYAPKNSKNPNLDGISRDHIISITEGFRLGIPAELISHPANCELMRHTENQSKYSKSGMDINELKNKINQW
jgi:ribosomal protein S16